MGVKQENGDPEKIPPPIEQKKVCDVMIRLHCNLMITINRISHEMDTKVKKYLGGEGANLEVLKDKKLKGQLSAGEDLH
ncbi:U3 small nucleolar RNA-associated protein [Salix suchowensis]|nr:U3 small nucleolar RNA-associated protein [Salix suchowensis]